MTASASYLWRLCLVLAGVVNSAGLAVGQQVPRLQQEVFFHIEKGPLESALIQFSRQAEVQVVLAPNSAANLISSAVHGRFSASAALTTLLKGTGLAYTAMGNTVTVQSPGNKATRTINPQEPTASVSQKPKTTRL